MPTNLMKPSTLLPAHEIRKLVARGFSAMYGSELPEYNRFIAPVRDSNLQQLEKNPDPSIRRETLMEEKHGAIRVPGPEEMRIVARIFAVIGMHPVEFYDMTILGAKSLPMIATAFRAIDKSIEESAFRMFCSMLHVASVSPALKDEVLAELGKNRKLYPKFSHELLAMLDMAERQGGFEEADAKQFTALVVEAFSMHKDKIVDFAVYSKLRKVSDPLADIVLESPVLNHLTPRALDIEDAVDKLNSAGIPMQTAIQGPPIRLDGVQIQLNQIARIAAGEDVYVAVDPKVLDDFEHDPSASLDLKAKAPRIELQQGEKVDGYMVRVAAALGTNPVVIIHHKARFGEIESRGVALTVEGEAAYSAYEIESESDPATKAAKIERFKSEYPKTHRQLHDLGWAYYTYRVTGSGNAEKWQGETQHLTISQLLDSGYVTIVPQPYHDFLPFSAAAIFRANSTEGTQGIDNSHKDASNNKKALEKAMGVLITSRHDIHQREQAESVRQVYDELKIVPRPRPAFEVEQSEITRIR